MQGLWCLFDVTFAGNLPPLTAQPSLAPCLRSVINEAMMSPSVIESSERVQIPIANSVPPPLIWCRPSANSGPMNFEIFDGSRVGQRSAWPITRPLYSDHGAQVGQENMLATLDRAQQSDRLITFQCVFTAGRGVI